MIKINCKILDLSPKTGEEKRAEVYLLRPTDDKFLSAAILLSWGFVAHLKKKKIKD